MKKKLLVLTTICALAFSMIACGNSEDAASTAELGTFTFDVPEGFVETSENNYSPEDSTKTSSINYLTESNDGSFDQVNAEVLMQATEAQIESIYETDVTFTLLEEEFYEISGCRAFKLSIEYELLGIKLVQTQCIVETSDTLHFVTYTEVNDEGYLDAFKTSMESIRFE